jgi:invasion protein IalB
MSYSTASAAVKPASPMLAALARSLAMAVGSTLPLALAFAIVAGSPAFAQQQEPAPAPGAAAPSAPAAKPKPKKPKPAAQAPAPAPAQAQQPPAAAPAPQPQPGQAPAPGQEQAQGQGQQQVQLIYSPWTKFCLKGQEANAKQVCFTGKDARIESGMPVVAAVIIEPEGQDRKVLRVTLPLGMQLVHGTRVIIDQNQPMTAPYVICFTNGCMADYEANADMISKFKKGQGLVVQAINSTGQPISLVLPLADFAKAYDGPPTDPKVFEEQQRKLQEELQRRADEARKKLENQQQGAPQSQAPAPSAASPAPAKTQ